MLQPQNAVNQYHQDVNDKSTDYFLGRIASLVGAQQVVFHPGMRIVVGDYIRDTFGVDDLTQFAGQVQPDVNAILEPGDSLTINRSVMDAVFDKMITVYNIYQVFARHLTKTNNTYEMPNINQFNDDELDVVLLESTLEITEQHQKNIQKFMDHVQHIIPTTNEYVIEPGYIGQFAAMISNLTENWSNDDMDPEDDQGLTQHDHEAEQFLENWDVNFYTDTRFIYPYIPLKTWIFQPDDPEDEDYTEGRWMVSGTVCQVGDPVCIDYIEDASSCKCAHIHGTNLFILLDQRAQYYVSRSNQAVAFDEFLLLLAAFYKQTSLFDMGLIASDGLKQRLGDLYAIIYQEDPNYWDQYVDFNTQSLN